MFFIIFVIQTTKGENVHFVSLFFKMCLIQGDVVGDSADIGFVGVGHHANAHIVLPFRIRIVRHREWDVKQ